MDKEYTQLKDQRAAALKELEKMVQPDIIIGDFNSEIDEQHARDTLKTHPVYRGLTNKAKDQFMQYYLSGSGCTLMRERRCSLLWTSFPGFKLQGTLRPIQRSPVQ